MDVKKGRRLGDCELCNKKDTNGETNNSPKYTCAECISIIDQWNALDNVSFVKWEKK